MTHISKTLTSAARNGLFALLATTLPMFAQAAHHEAGEAAAPAAAAAEPSGRAMALQIEAVVTAVDLETRQVSLQGPDGTEFTVASQENVVKLEDVSVGDRLLVTYLAALEGEIREPTEVELAEPWAVIEEEGISEEPGEPGVAVARMIRAVVTIEGMNRELGLVTVKDSRGKLHVIGDVEPEKMEGVTLGQTAVIVYAEALAISLEHKEAAAE